MRERIERAFEAWGHFVYRRAVLVIGVVMIIAVMMRMTNR